MSEQEFRAQLLEILATLIAELSWSQHPPSAQFKARFRAFVDAATKPNSP